MADQLKSDNVTAKSRLCQKELPQKEKPMFPAESTELGLPERRNPTSAIGSGWMKKLPVQRTVCTP